MYTKTLTSSKADLTDSEVEDVGKELKIGLVIYFSSVSTCLESMKLWVWSPVSNNNNNNNNNVQIFKEIKKETYKQMHEMFIKLNEDLLKRDKGFYHSNVWWA